MELLSQHSGRRHLPDGLPGLALEPADHRRPPGRGAREPRRAASQVFGPEDVYFEIQKNGIAEQDVVNDAIAKFAREMGRPLVATADVHYLREEDHFHHSALLCVQTKSTLADPKMKFDTNEFYLKSTEEMGSRVRGVPGLRADLAGDRRALQRRDRARPDADPALPVPGRHGGARLPARAGQDGPARALRGPAARRRDRAHGDGARRHRAHGLLRLLPDRLGLHQLGQANGIAVGPGRGSAAGSLVAYCLRITDLDPLRYDLLFERFLNPERVSMPDIDIDFSVRGRERVMRYVIDKYGTDRVAQIITFGKMFPRAATRDAARVLGYEYGKGDALAKLIPDPIMGRAPSFRRVPRRGADLARRSGATPRPRRSSTSPGASRGSSATPRSTPRPSSSPTGR